MNTQLVISLLTISVVCVAVLNSYLHGIFHIQEDNFEIKSKKHTDFLFAIPGITLTVIFYGGISFTALLEVCEINSSSLNVFHFVTTFGLLSFLFLNTYVFIEYFTFNQSRNISLKDKVLFNENIEEKIENSKLQHIHNILKICELKEQSKTKTKKYCKVCALLKKINQSRIYFFVNFMTMILFVGFDFSHNFFVKGINSRIIEKEFNLNSVKLNIDFANQNF